MTGDILLLTPSWGGGDGLSVLAGQYASALHEASGGRLTVWTLVGGDDAAPRIAGERVRIRPFNGQRAALGRAALESAMIASSHYRLVITLHVNQLPVAAPLVLAGVPLVHVVVGIESWRPLNGVRAATLRRASRQIAISAYTRRRFAEANPRLVANGAEVIHPHTPPLPAAPVTSRPAPEAYALIVGRMAAEERYKGHDLLIDIWRDIRGGRLVCAGAGDDLPRLQARVHDAGLQDVITFAGRVSEEQLAVLYRDCAFFVLPSSHEGFGLVYLEAMAAARPCVGVRGPAEEIIAHQETGLIADVRTSSALADAMTRLFADPALRSEMGRAGCVRAATVFGRERFMRELRRVLEPWL